VISRRHRPRRSGVLEKGTNEHLIDADATARALRGASDAARTSCAVPSRGTMLSVNPRVAEEARARASRTPPIGEGLLLDWCAAAMTRVARTPEQMQVLKDAGVSTRAGAGIVEPYAVQLRP